MKHSIITLLLSFGLVNAQQTTIDNQKFECRYLFTYQQDSTNANNQLEETFLLKVGDEKSLFVSENRIKRDSAMAE